MNPFQPYSADWAALYAKESWVFENKDNVERVFTKLWQETCSTVGLENNTLTIHEFAEYWYTHLKVQRSTDVHKESSKLKDIRND